MGLEIGGRRITNIDDDVLVANFGLSYQQSERVGDTIAWYIEDSQLHSYDTIGSFVAAVAGISQGSHLVIQRTHPTHPGPYTITMTGSRSGDYAAANAKAFLSATPGGYTWHHREGVTVINLANREIECSMYLIETTYHSAIRHRGGVYEYEHYTGVTYG